MKLTKLDGSLCTMLNMEGPAKTLMNVKQPGGMEKYGPDFVI